MSKIALVVALAILLLTVTAPRWAAEGAIRIAGATYLGDLPTLVAENDGIFATRVGLPVAASYDRTGADNLKRLRAGEIDIAAMAIAPLIRDALSDTTPGGDDDPIIIANMMHSNGLNHVVAFADSGISHPADLAGKRLGLQMGTSSEFAWWLTTRYFVLPHASTELVNMPVESLGDALLKGDIDAAALWDPWVDRLRARSDRPLLTLEGSGIYSGRWLLVTTRRFIRESPNRTAELLASYRAAVDHIEAHPEEALAVYARHFQVPQDLAEKKWQALEYDINLDWSLIAGMQQHLEWAQTAYPVARLAPLDTLALIATEPLRDVAPVAVALPAPAPAQP